MSRHIRYTPTDEARQLGWATSPIAASSVGYTRAVPRPRRAEPKAKDSNDRAEAMTAIPTAWVHIPRTIGDFRPTRSERAPAKSCPTPQTPG